MQQIKGKVALITGGTKGIGYGIAEALLREGLNVVITGRTEKTVEEAIALLNKNKNDLSEVVGWAADVRIFEDLQTVVAKTIDRFGKIDVVIANAGIGHFAPIHELSLRQWNETIDVNLTGAFYTLKASVEALSKTKGYYMTISSLAGTNFFANGSAYNASKFGLTGFTQAAMLDLRKYHIKVTTIMPGSVSTHFNGNTPSEAGSWKIQIEDLGQVVVDLLKIHPRTLPSKVEIRPSNPPSKS